MVLFWPQITRWLQRFMARRAEDMVRKMAGMPTRKEEEERRRKRQESARQQQQRRQHDYSGTSEDIVRRMQAYAEDVDFVETKDYSGTGMSEDDGKRNKRIYCESQVSDAEYTEIKNKR